MPDYISPEVAAEAFYPCVPRGLVDEWHRLNLAMSEVRRDREAPARELLRLSVEGADMSVEPCFRLGAVIEGTDCKVQAVWHLTDDGRRWLPRLEYVREVQEEQDGEDANAGRKGSTGRTGASGRASREDVPRGSRTVDVRDGE